MQTFQQVFANLQSILAAKRDQNSQVLIFATCEKASDIGEPFSKLFRDKFSIKLPEKNDREAIIGWILQKGGLEYDII